MVIKKLQDEIQNFLVDSSNIKGSCDAVYFPLSATDIQEILKESNKTKTKVTIAGNGTGLTGGRVPFGGIVISTEKLNKILEVNTREHYAVVEPGVILNDFQSLLNEKGFFYPPDPTETNSFIGASIANNSSGAKTFKYGATRNFVEEIEVILTSGEKLLLKRGKNFAKDYQLKLKTREGTEYRLQIPNYEMPDVKNASGYYCKKDVDTIDLFIGSEGTLGVVTKAKLKILPLPYNILSCVVFFENEMDGIHFIEEARTKTHNNRKSKIENSFDARALEYWDENSLKFLIEEYTQLDAAAKSSVWFEQETTEENQDALMEEWFDLIKKHNGNDEKVWAGVDENDREKIRKYRHAISEKVVEYVVRNNFSKLGTDVAVPDYLFEKFYVACKRILEGKQLHYIGYGHFGNSHIHFNILPKTDEEFKKGKEVYDIICKLAVGLGGTVSAEHGIGKIKREHLLMMYGEANIKQMANLKKQLDPNLILNIGNIFDERYL
jgi:D-lactate dehydrogenase (cytochrome)